MDNTDLPKDGVKVSLIKKSGPGDIVGITEVISTGGQSIFDKIQFNAPGEYIISVITDNQVFNNQEITITVNPEEIIPQENSRDIEEEPQGNRPVLSMVQEPLIRLDPITFEATGNDTEDASIQKGLGLTPFVWYNGYQISQKDLFHFELFYDGIIPCCNIRFIDTVGFMKKDGFPLDDTKFEVFLNPDSKTLKHIHLKFKVMDFIDQKNNTYKIYGAIDLRDFYSVGYRSYTGTSYDVLKEIATELELGYYTNINSTNDTMKWINNGETPNSFIDSIIKHSYLSDNSFVAGYIDFYYGFNYIDIEKEWLRDISNDIGISSTGLNSLSSEDKREEIVELLLSNDKAFMGSPFYIESYKLYNQSTSISTSQGYYTKTKVYDTNKKEFLIFDIKSLTSDGDKSHILKGLPGDPDYQESNYRTKYGGKIDTSNVHQNYHYAEILNEVNLNNLSRVYMDITLATPNFNLYRYQKVAIRMMIDRAALANDKLIDERLSGEWLITDISFVWKGGALLQVIRVSTKEISKTAEEIKATNYQSEQPVNTENNENPVPDAPQEDRVYQVGQRYNVVNSSGIKYQILVTEVIDDKNIKGEIRNV